MSRKNKEARVDINVFMGPESEFEGKLHFTGSVRVDGRITGQISSQGLLIVGPTAQVYANAEVDTIIICGEFRGDILAAERVELRPPAKFFGTLTAPSLVMHEGAIFEGVCQMSQARQAVANSQKVALLHPGREAAVG